MNAWSLPAFWVTTLLICVVATLARSFQATPPGLLRRQLQDWLPKGVDEGEKIRRIGITLDLWFHLLWVSWVLLLVATALTDGVWLFQGTLIEENHLRLAPLVGIGVWLFVFTLVFLDFIPRVVGAWRGEPIALGAVRFLARLERVCSPLTTLLRGSQKAFLRFLGNGKERSEADIAEEGIRAAVEVGEREGVLEKGEKSMIESLLEFHDAEVVEVMTPRTDMICVDASSAIEEVIPIAIGCGHSRIPAYTENIDSIVGVLYVKDLLRYLEPEQRKLPVEKAVRKIYFVPESKNIGELLAEFRAERFHIAVVLDEYGGTSGLVTIEDILEEIVGEIEDEYDPARRSSIRRIDDDTYDIDGRVHVYDLRKALGIDLPESDDYETMAGFIFSTLGKVPEEGEEFEFENLRLKVIAADERKIKRIRLQVLHPQSQDLE